MNYENLLSVIELGGAKIIELKKEKYNINYKNRTIPVNLGNEVYYNDLIPIESDFNNKKDFSRYIFLSSFISHLEFLLEDIHDIYFGEQQKEIKKDYEHCYEEHMNGINSAIIFFADLF